ARRGLPNRLNPPKISEAQILVWADAYHARTGHWPKRNSGPLEEAPDLTWAKIDSSLIQGSRSLPGGSSLAQFLMERRGVRHHLAAPRLTQEGILQWADAYYARLGRWPNVNSGPIEEA